MKTFNDFMEMHYLKKAVKYSSKEEDTFKNCMKSLDCLKKAMKYAPKEHRDFVRNGLELRLLKYYARQAGIEIED